MEKVKSLGSWEEIMETLKKRLEEQQGRHQGGNKWVGTGGTSPFGNSGYNPEGVRIGGESRHKHAIKVWDRSEEHTSELQSLMRISYAVFCLKKKTTHTTKT